MRIKTVKIENYRSLKSVLLEDFSQINVLIGKNGSGKSNLLETLETFFRDFDPALEKPAAVPDHLWFTENTNLEISIGLTLGLSSSEIVTLGTENFRKVMPVAGEYEVQIDRAISAFQGKRVWKTNTLIINGMRIIEGTKVAAEFDTKLREVEPTLKAENEISQFLSSLTTKTKNNFRLIAPTRDQSLQTSTPIGERTAFLDTDTQNSIRNLSQSTAPSEKKTWRDIKTNLSSVLDGKDLEVSSNQIFLSEGSTKLPIYLHGGGQQEIVGIVRYIEELASKGVTIFGIEEPEMHLHPHAQRQLFDYIKSKKQAYQFFISTHSPIFINKTGGTYLFTKSDTYSEVKKVSDKNSLKEVIVELGGRPSDMLLADKVLFVEGESDKIFFLKCASLLNLELEDRIAIITLKGVNKARHNFKFWLEVSKEASLPIYIIADSGSQTESEVKTLITYGLITSSEKFIKLSKNAIEEFYPRTLVNEFLRGYDAGSVQNDNFTIKDIEKLSKIPKSWKILLVEYVTDRLQLEQMPEEIKKALEDVAK